MAAALGHYEAGLTMIQALVAQDPTNTGFQRDLSVSQDKLGDIRLQLGETAAALGHYEAGLTIRQALVTQDPANTEFQRDLWVSYSKLAVTHEANKNYTAALRYMTLVHEQLDRMRNGGVLAEDDIQFIESTEAEIERLKQLLLPDS
jgi:tetratricopeptide (TPR) repeat protein